MIKNWKITISFFVASGLVNIISESINQNELNIAGLLGSTVGLFIFPLIITYIIKGVYKLFKKDLQDNGFVATYTIAWGLFVASNLIVTTVANQPNSLTDRNTSEYLYAPKNSEYSIVFSIKPTITAAAVPSGSDFIRGEIAEATLTHDGSFQRVEFYVLNESLLNSIDEEYAYSFLSEYSRHNGFSHPELKFEENKNEKYAELRAYKEFTDNKESKRMVTYVVKLYVKGTSFFVTYVGSESKDFPTTEIVRFWGSIKRVNLLDGQGDSQSNSKTINGWTKENIEKLKAKCLEGFERGLIPKELKDKNRYCDCMADKTVNGITWDEFLQPTGEIQKLHQENGKICAILVMMEKE